MVPNYLAPVADRITEKKDATTFFIKCSCGCSVFLLAKSKNEKNVKENAFNSYWNSFKLPIFSWKDAVDKKTGERYLYGTTFFGIRLGKFYFKDFPDLNEYRIIKAKCCQCGKEFIVFDNRYYGYNALTENELQPENCEFIPKFSWTKTPKEIVVVVRNNLPYEEFRKEFGESREKYSNAFESIDIYTMSNGVKKLFFEEETA